MHFLATFALVALPFFAAATPASETAQGISIPIERYTRTNVSAREAATANIRNSIAKVQRGVDAYKHNTGLTHHLAEVIQPAVDSKKRATASEMLTAYRQMSWYGKISVGTPAVTFLIEFDTGSSDLYLPGSSCDDSCGGRTLYDPSKSSTAKDVDKPFVLTYTDSSLVFGEQYTDTVTVSGLTATNQALGAAELISGYIASNKFPPNGYLGMAFPALSKYKANPFFQTLIAQGKVSSPVFGFKLTQSGGSLYLGGLDASLYSGSFTYVLVQTPSFWEIPLDGINISGKRIVGTGTSIIDTGTALIVGDPSSVAAVYSAIGGASENGDGTYTVPCNASPSVSLTFGGKAFSLSTASFVIPNGDGTCIGGISHQFGANTTGLWTVGDVFLQNVYTAFDVGNERVGFAALK